MLQVLIPLLPFHSLGKLKTENKFPSSPMAAQGKGALRF